jgi:nucleoside 2-deoxyribosyltransferase
MVHERSHADNAKIVEECLVYPADFRHEIQEHCPLCGCKPKQLQEDTDRSIWHVDCAVCSRYRITEELLMMLRSGEMRADVKLPLSAVVRRHWEYTRRPELLTSINSKDLASSIPTKNDVPTKVRYLLAYIAHKSSFPGERITLKGQTDYPVCFAANIDEFGFYAQFIKEAGFVDGQRAERPLEELGDYHYWLTAKGWEEIERVPTLDSPYAFVAMSFTKDGEYGSLLTQAYEQAIMPAVEQDAGYKAVRVDREEFLGDIVFEIIARLRECRFLVADVTEHKNGVYFEAGYAMGMGLPVTWTCHKDHMAQAHFDTSHMNHIVWEDIAGLRKALANRVLATIGRCPATRTKAG